MKNNNDIIKQKFKLSIAISKIKNEEENSHKKNFNIKKLGIVASICLTLITGTVFAKDIERFIKDKFGLGKGVQTAVDNGYISSNENIKFIDSIVNVVEVGTDYVSDNFKTGVRITDFLISDTTLTFNMEIKFDEKINKYKNLNEKANGNLDYESFGNVGLELFVLDNEKNLIVAPVNEDDFNKFCDEQNLDFEYLNFKENYLNCVINCDVTEIDPDNNIIKITCIISGDNIPNAKELDLFLNKIIFTPKGIAKNDSKNVFLEGEWKINLDIPKYMYNREDIFYKVVSCENENFNVYTAKATNVGFEIGINISNIDIPNLESDLIDTKTGLSYIFNSKEELLSVSKDKEFEEKYIKYKDECEPIRLWGKPPANWLERSDGCYILDENGNKFFATKNNTKKQNANFKYDVVTDINGYVTNKYLNEFDFYNEFSITKYNLTDKLVLIIDYYGNPVKIKLEKIN